MKITGKCLCGAVRFTAIPKEGGLVEACHCTMCQRWNGGVGFAISLVEPPIYQAGADLVKIYKSSEWGQRRFCKVCGTSLGSDAPGFGYFSTTPGVLEDTSGLTLHKEVFIEKKPGYYCFEGERPKLTEAEFLAIFSSPTNDGNNGDVGNN